MAISDKLQELINIKQDIKVAIENKGADLTGVEFSGYAGKIDEIETGGGTSGGYTVTFKFNNMAWFPRTRIKQANGNDFLMNTLRSYDFHYDPVVFENVTYIHCENEFMGNETYSGITVAELLAGKTLTNDIELVTHD